MTKNDDGVCRYIMAKPCTLKILYRSLLVLAAVSFLAGCANRPEPPLRIGTNVWPGYEPLFLARDLGYYDGTPIKLVEYPSASEVLRAFRNGAIEVAALTMDEVMLLADQNQEPRIILITDISNGADVILSSKGIKKMQDLKGKVVGVEVSALGAFVLTRALEQANMSIDDVKILPVEPSKHERAFKTGEVDAVVTFEPVRSKLISSGANIIFESTQIPGEIVDVLAVRRDVLNNRSTLLRTLINGWFSAISYLEKNPSDAGRRMAPREGVDPAQFLNSLKGLHIPDINENLRLLSGGHAQFLSGTDTLARVMVEKRLISKEVKAADLLDDSLVKKVKQ